MPTSLFRISGDDLLHLGKKPEPGSVDKSLAKSKGGGPGRTGKKTIEDRARADSEKAALEDAPTPEMVQANTPRPDTPAARPKATLKKASWSAATIRYNTDAEAYAEFDVPPGMGERTLVEFQFFRKEQGEFKPYHKAQGHADASGRASVKCPLRKIQDPKDKPEDPKAIFLFKVKHCSSEWSSGEGTEREVFEAAEIGFEHTQVSGIHFPKDKSFIADVYLDASCEVRRIYLAWKKTHDKAQLIVYGHCEKDEEDPLNLSRNRALSAFSFIIGDVERWASLAEKERWSVWEQQIILRALGFLKAKPTGTLGPKTRQAIKDFITFLNEARCKTFNPMLGLSEAYIRKELYREYMNLKRSEFELPSSSFRAVSGYPYVGCCSFNRYQSREILHDENRRVVFLILQDSPNFPVTFPCRSGSVGACEDQCKKPGDRAIRGFRCKFYDEMVKDEKVGEAANSGNDHEIETHWEGYPGQNDFNDDIYAAAKKYSIDPLILKSLIAQESRFEPKICNDFGFAGLTQIGGAAVKEAGLDIGATTKTSGKYVYDKNGDERFDPKKSINAGAHILSLKRSRVDQMIFSKFKTQPLDQEKQKLYLAAYNAGEGIVKNAWEEYGKKDCSWEDLIEGGENSALYKVIPESWNPDSKYSEISEYPIDILRRARS